MPLCCVFDATESGRDITAPILAIDDDRVFLDFLRMLLESEQYAVVTVASLAEARAWLATNRPAMVIGDARLADGPDFAVVDLVAELPGPPVPLLLTTAFPPARVARYVEADRCPGLSILYKPFAIEELLGHVARLLAPA